MKERGLGWGISPTPDPSLLTLFTRTTTFHQMVEPKNAK